MTPDILNTYHEATESLVEALQRAAKLHNKLRVENNLPLGDNNIWHDYPDDVEWQGDKARIIWSTSWQYGGHDCGHYFIPIAALMDDTYEKCITEIVEKDRVASVEKHAKNIVNQRLIDQAELQRLQKKLNA